MISNLVIRYHDKLKVKKKKYVHIEFLKKYPFEGSYYSLTSKIYISKDFRNSINIEGFFYSKIAFLCIEPKIYIFHP